MRLTIFALFIFLMLLLPASAADWYVSVDGDNTNPGTLEQPKKNFSNTGWFNSTNVKPGDTVYLIGSFNNGTSMVWYNETLWISSSTGVKYVTGNSTAWLKITSYNGTPTFDGVDTLATKYGVFTNPSCCVTRNINVSNLTFLNQGYGGYIRNSDFINFDNITMNLSNVSASNNLFNFIDVTNSSITNGTYTYGGENTLSLISTNRNVTNVTISGNKIHENSNHGLIDFSNAGSAGNANHISDILINNNELYNGTLPSFFSHWSGHNKIYNVTFTNNTIHNMSGLNIALNMLVDSIFQNNTIRDSAGSFYSVTNEAQINITVRNNTVVNVTTPTDIELPKNGSITFINNSIIKYLVYVGNVTVQDPRSNFTLQTVNLGTIVLNYTAGNVFSESGANITHYYSDRSEYITSGNETVVITPYNITVRVSQNNATATNTTTNLAIDQQNNTIGHIYINFSAPIPQMNISLSNVSSGTSLSLRYAGNNTEIAYFNVSSNLTAYFNNSLGNDNYNLTEASQGTPAATRVPLTYAANYVVAGSAIGLSAVLYITYRRRRGRVMMFIPILLYNNRRRR